MWYNCTTCHSQVNIGTVRSVNQGWIKHCPLCGCDVSYVNDTQEQWWLSIQQHYDMDADLLSQLLGFFEQQHNEPRFDVWLKKFEAGEVE